MARRRSDPCRRPDDPHTRYQNDRSPFFQPNPDDPGAYLVSPAGTILLCSTAIHDPEAGAQCKTRAIRLIHAVLDAAQAADYTQGQIAETVLLDVGQSMERKKDIALELAGILGCDRFIASMRRAGFNTE